jgi:hypothetical protein
VLGKGAVAFAGISAHTRARTIALLRTLDVRQIRRKFLGKRKAPGMKSYPSW